MAKYNKNNQEAQLTLSQSSSSWDVDLIIDKKYIENNAHYLLKWKNFPNSENSWEPASHLTNCAELLKLFELNRGKQLEDYRQRHSAEVGFARGLEPDFVVGVTDVMGKLLYGVKWVDNMDADIIDGTEVKEKCPHLVLEFFLDVIGYKLKSIGSDADFDKLKFNGVPPTLPIECSSAHTLQSRLDHGFTIEEVMDVIQDPETKDVMYQVHWCSNSNDFKVQCPEDDYLSADCAHRFFQMHVIRYYEDKFYYRQKYRTHMKSDVRAPLL